MVMVDKSGVSKEKLRGCVQVLQELSSISEKFSIAAAFSNVHDVYKAGNVKLQPELLKNVRPRRSVENVRSLLAHTG